MLLVALTPCQSGENAVTRALYFLACHQGEDGSWGQILEASCRCRPRISVQTRLPIPIDPVLEIRYQSLAAGLKDDAIQVRERAQQDIQRLGAGAVPLLQRSLDHQDPEVALRCRNALREIWSSDPKIQTLCLGLGWTPDEDYQLMATGLGLLTFLGAGYTHLSRDHRIGSRGRDFVYGDVVGRAARWLILRQGPDGSYAVRSPVVHAIVTTALSEIYGMTAAKMFLEPATRSVAFLKSVKCSDETFLVWKGIALHSAHSSELADCTIADCNQMSKVLAEESSPAAVSAALLLSICGKRGTEGLRLRLEEIGAKEPTPLEEWLVTAAVQRCCDDTVRKHWRARIWQRLTESQEGGDGCEAGSWGTTGKGWHQNLITTMYAMLTMERSYRTKYTLFWSPWED